MLVTDTVQKLYSIILVLFVSNPSQICLTCLALSDSQNYIEKDSRPFRDTRDDSITILRENLSCEFFNKKKKKKKSQIRDI